MGTYSTILVKLRKLYGNLNFDDLIPSYMALADSALRIFFPCFLSKKVKKKHVSMEDVLNVRHLLFL
jgi:hypothetical protein